ncbi:MAG: Stp1/IreP family PP2C-type Ser/Thr phosphatase [Oscillospiraceae bacterium]|nr:Stp1/IreP family PP2C-type Ser/Thr phosphatase [Oscillospiraceae bacterium]
MELWGATNSGKIRRQNQDVFKTLFDDDKKIAILVVCDGMGGAKAGNVASMLAAETFMHHMGKYVEGFDESETVKSMTQKMTESVFAANRAVFMKSSRDDEFAGMGTTLTAALSYSGGEIIVNIGDSRAYYIQTGNIKQITRDHSVVEDMIIRGDLTRAESYMHPSKHLITRALGTSNIEKPDVFFLAMDSGEQLLLCSDGVSNIVMDDEILIEMQRGKDARECCENLIEISLARGAPDNVTAVVFTK